MPDADRVATILAEMKRVTACLMPLPREHALLAEQVAEFVPPLLAAVEAVLALADDWEATASTLDGGTARANALLDCTASFREAITAALAGKEPGDAG